MELKEYAREGALVAGCDEAGRGCLAGPVVAAAVILPGGFSHPLLNDSKKMTAAARLAVREAILEKAVAWAVGLCEADEIDRINILNASFLAMHRAVDGLKVSPDLLLVDGNRFNRHPAIPHTCVVGGDGVFTCIAAASVLAKTTRDALMEDLHHQYPQYGWMRNKAYGTKAHMLAIANFGRTPQHRKTFLKGKQLALAL